MNINSKSNSFIENNELQFVINLNLLTYKYELHKKYKKFCMFKIIPIVKNFG